MKIKSLFLLFALLVLHPVVAQTQAQMNQEADAAFKKSDTELNLVYKQLVSMLNAKEKKLLVRAQKNWIRFRDAHCQFEIVSYEGGSIRPLVFSNCMTDCTNARIADLKASITERQR